MSQSTAVRTTRAVPRQTPALLPPQLRLVTLPGPARSRAGLAAACLLALAAGLIGLLLLNVSLERGAYVLRDQERRTNELREQRGALAQAIQSRQAPGRLAADATRLGMVFPSTVAWIDADGKRYGVARPAPTPAAPSVVGTVTTP
jgi:hypothetical protein